MGNRRMGLGRMEKLLESVDRDLNLENTTLTAPTITGALAVTMIKNVVDLDGATAAPTVAQSGTIFTFDGSACTVTLPTCAVGLEYTFLVKTTVSGASIITTATNDKLYGTVLRAIDGLSATHADDGTQTDSNTGTNDNTYTMNGTTKGGIIGTRIHVIGMKALTWYITGTSIGSGDQITCFS